MRSQSRSTFIATNPEQTETMESSRLTLEQNISFFQVKLRELDNKSSVAADVNEGVQLCRERETVKALIESLQLYISELKCKTTLGVARNKMSEADIAVLEAQAAGIQKMRSFVDPAQGQSNNQLSELIDSAAKMEYQISYRRVWLRRAASVLGGLAAIAATVAVGCILMSPGVHIPAAMAMIPTMLASVAAFLYFRQKPATIHTPVNIGAFHTTAAVNVPTTLGVLGAGVIGASLFAKLRVTNPAREEAARKVGVNTMNYASDELRKKIEKLVIGEDVKQFLLSVVDQADKMYNSGVESWFYESRSSKMTKASLILRETAKLVERADIGTFTLDAILANRVENADYSFRQLLNAQRNRSLFSNRSSRLFKAVSPNRKSAEEACVNLNQFITA